MYNPFKKLLVFTTMLSMSVMLFAQSSLNSPYSRYGLGDLSTMNFAPVTMMGGISAGYADAYFTNVDNPASLGALTATSFEVGFDAIRKSLKVGDEKEAFWGGNLNYFSLAFPLINSVNRLLDRRSSDFNWGMSISLLPNSRVSHYNSNDEFIEGVGNITREYAGSGGTNRVMIGNGAKYKNWYFGLNLGYMFGSIKDERAVLYEDVTTSANYSLQESAYRGFFWKLGTQYELDLSNGKGAEDPRAIKSLRFGLTYNSKWNFTTVSYAFDAIKSSNYAGLSDDFADEETDTISVTDALKQTGTYPGEMSLGMTYRRGTKWVAGVNFRMGAWSNYENESQGENLNLANAYEFGIGGQWVPDATSYRFYHRRMMYRAGFTFGQDPRMIDGEQIKTWRLHAGIGLPVVLSRQLSFINLGVEYGNNGGNIPIREGVFRFNVGFTLNNNLWFYKRKYD